MQKEFDLIHLLEETIRSIDDDALKLQGRKDAYKDLISFLKMNSIKVIQEVPDPSSEDAPKEVKTKDTKENSNVAE